MKQKPYNLLLLTGFILVLISFFVLKQNNTVDIHLHDTYFVVAYTHIFWLLASIALVLWKVYLLTKKLLYSTSLIWVHVVITILTLLLFAVTFFWDDGFVNPATRRYYDYSNWNSLTHTSGVAKVSAITIRVLIFVQLVFIINFISGLIKRLANRNN